MFWLTEKALLTCKHQLGVVVIVATQSLVSINGQRVLAEGDPAGRPILGCPNLGATIKPCLATLPVRTGYSDLLRVEGRRICLDTVTGLTDGTPPGTVAYQVRGAGQSLVSEAS